MKKLILALVFMVAACANPPPLTVSALEGYWNYGASQVTFTGLTSGTFVYQKCNIPGFQFPESGTNDCTSGCSQTGWWQDLNPGSSFGEVQLTIQFNTCDGLPEYTVITEPYSIGSGSLTLQVPL